MANPQKASPKFQSFNWLRGIVDDKRIPVVHRIVLIRLCLHRFNDSGKCNPGYDVVASEIGVHRATVFRAVDVGVRFGWLVKPIRHGQRPADFVFTFPSNVAGERHQEDANVAGERPQQEDPNVAAERHQTNPNVAGVQSQSRTRAHAKSQRQRGSPAKSKASTRNGRPNGERERGTKEDRGTKRAPEPPTKGAKKKETGGEENNSANSKPARRQSKNQGERRGAAADDAGDDGFARFWAIYPRKVSEDDARDAFTKALAEGADIDVIVNGAAIYAALRAAAVEHGDDPKWTLYPATWLKKRKWKDPPPPGAVIDQDGNVVAVERQEARPSSTKSPLEIYEEWLEENPSLRW